MNGAILGMRRAEIQRKFDEIVAFAEIEKFLDTPVKRYSSGMYVRLAFAVAAHLEPEILLVDEVLAVGDAQFQKKCLGKMGEVAKGGRTVLFVSHNMASIQTLCQSAILLKHGQVIEIGNVNSTVIRYLKTLDDEARENITSLGGIKRVSGLISVFRDGWINRVPIVGEHSVEPFSTLCFELNLDFPEPMPHSWMGIYLESETGIKLIGANTRWIMRQVSFDAGKYSIRCNFKNIPLAPGQYYVSLGFSSQRKQIDQIERIASLNILASDVYGTGELPWSEQGFLLSDAEWQIDKNLGID
jgi:lipopolysaccharide transport system ATP-binding protein